MLVTESLLRLARLEQDREREFELPHLLDDGMLEVAATKNPGLPKVVVTKPAVAKGG